MSAIRDLFGDFEPAPAPPAAPAPAVALPSVVAALLAPPIAPAARAWRYIHPEGVPGNLIAFECLCGARDERPRPSLDSVTCWSCRQQAGMRARPWRPTAAEIARWHPAGRTPSNPSIIAETHSRPLP